MVEKTIELTGASAAGIEDAVALAVARAGVTIEGIRRVEVVEIGAEVEDNAITLWRVRVKVTFGVHDQLHE
ncbi:MAG: hypothetical protein KatS3mg076_1340 [Candidatus Binatia bacterium]|nr:MAG: hypothetical protein KatS3mg076_1340 [Candidatus Binatia bacterium]